MITSQWGWGPALSSSSFISFVPFDLLFLDNGLETIFNIISMISSLAFINSMYKNRTIWFKEYTEEIFWFKSASTNYSCWWLTFGNPASICWLMTNMSVVNPRLIACNYVTWTKFGQIFTRKFNSFFLLFSS